MVTYGLTACTPGSAPGPTLGIEYGKAFTFTFVIILHHFHDIATSRWYVNVCDLRITKSKFDTIMKYYTQCVICVLSDSCVNISWLTRAVVTKV